MRHLPYPKTKLQVVIAGVILALILVAGSFFALHHQQKHDQPAAPETITHSTDTPDETKPAANYTWNGNLNDPKRISLPTINTEGYIQRVGVDQNKEIAVPNNVHMAGWFVDSVRPGSMGLSIIDGHVDGRIAIGIFKELAKLEEGNTFNLEMGDGKVLVYKVKQVVTLSIADTASVLFSQNPLIKNQLNLITCGGSFDKKTESYDKRVVVVSEQISS